MGDAAHEFNTKLELSQCKQIFQIAAQRSRGVSAKFSGFAAKLAGKDQGGFFTPTPLNDPFGEGQPDFSVGVWIERFSGGAQGAGYGVQMHVWDDGMMRRVNLTSPGGLTALYKPRQLIRKFTEAFQEADPKIPSA